MDQVEIEVRSAHTEHRTMLWYQPVVPSATGPLSDTRRCCGRGLAMGGRSPPAVSIPMAEEVGLISAVGRWVLHEAVTASSSGPPSASMAIYVSAKQLFDHHFAHSVERLVDTHGVDPSRVYIELTESRALDDPGALHMVAAVRDIGCRKVGCQIHTGARSPSCKTSRRRVWRDSIDPWATAVMVGSMSSRGS